ncbi:T9SS type A sorting domain-containing protein [Flammeovirga pacifica]|uniref:Secretion system C-terminal sorting domain-containing protein n=1 Tax=Flammeovirga pacifica TaxID=915059 RepID=A0A1S1YSC7_FLAPC|nr:T9SS type A sorting domain-containing protein [Flammeovirga pacifica]OHX63934.1 hypothetical protein NH26_20195 [Flammeovirga pacifica]
MLFTIKDLLTNIYQLHHHFKMINVENGKVINLDTNDQEGLITIDVNNDAKGMYLLEIQEGALMTHNQKVIIE